MLMMARPGSRLALQVFAGRCVELGLAPRAAEENVPTLMIRGVRRIGRNGHSAYRIPQRSDCGPLLYNWRLMIGVTGVRLAHLGLHGVGFAAWKKGVAKSYCRAIYTPMGYLSSTPTGYKMNEVRKKSVTALKRIEGQVRGVAKMIDEDRYCIDIVTQITAVRAALSKVETDLLRQHMGHCVSTAMKSRDPAEQERVINELMAVFRK